MMVCISCEKIAIDRYFVRFGGKIAKIARKWRKIGGIPSRYRNLTVIAKFIGLLAKSTEFYEIWPEIHQKLSKNRGFFPFLRDFTERTLS